MVSRSNSENEWDPPWPRPPGSSITRVFCPSAKQNSPRTLAPLCSIPPGALPAVARPCRPTSARMGAAARPAPAPRPGGLRPQEPRRFRSPSRSTAGAHKPPTGWGVCAQKGPTDRDGNARCGSAHRNLLSEIPPLSTRAGSPSSEPKAQRGRSGGSTGPHPCLATQPRGPQRLGAPPGSEAHCSPRPRRPRAEQCGTDTLHQLRSRELYSLPADSPAAKTSGRRASRGPAASPLHPRALRRGAPTMPPAPLPLSSLAHRVRGPVTQLSLCPPAFSVDNLRSLKGRNPPRPPAHAPCQL